MDSTLQDVFASIEVFDEESDWTPSQREVDTMKAYLSLKMPVEEAARSLTLRASQATEVDAMRCRRSMLWSLLNHIAVDLPVQPLIVDLLKMMRTIDPRDHLPRDSAGSLCPVDAWSKLDGWHNKWCDVLNYYEECHEIPRSKKMEIDGAKWPQVIAYSARLMASGDPGIVALFFIRRSSTCIIRALDLDISLEDSIHQADVIAAAQLFILCPRELLDRCQARDSIEGSENIRGTVLWPKDKMLEFSVERWQHWKTRWQDIKIASGATEEIKNCAINSLKAMEEVETD